MRILSISDIHGDIDAVEILMEQLSQKNFDVVVIAGDIGDLKEAKEICRIIATLNKEILYVMGNWDDYGYNEVLHKKATHIHLNHRKIGDWVFLGYSGSAANGYNRNLELEECYNTFEQNSEYNRRKFGTFHTFRKNFILSKIEDYIKNNNIDVEDLVLVTHDRLYSLNFYPFLYIYGHLHKPKHTYYKGTHFLNTSAVSNHSILSNLPSDTPGNFCYVETEHLDCKIEFNTISSPYICQHDKVRGGEVIKTIRKRDKKIIHRYFQPIFKK